ncbi:lipopolysaccharide biosynthesis protein [Fictibacillus arsenicus]|uniref:Sugar translocase n=1 Tax=Fictibacillus arsenicus TaxID=255247 RepID=A0A1V3GCM1_9BACL|nr:oligosaccharide flippase family protein [Fictibacillus arsenicus]OOE14585.1 sugar translocase [Fictibacillus arsenicus]
MRVQNSLKNIFFGLSSQFISIILGFIVRTIFIYMLGVEYLGIDGLFSSILMMLSLANLGFDTAIIYSLYKPLAEKNYYQIQALMNLYKKAYRIVALAVLVIGISIMPFLPSLMNGETTVNNINLIYLLFLINSVLSYLFIYKQSIVIADQRHHVISKIHTASVILTNLFQVMLLLLTANYIVFLIVQIICRNLENIYTAHIANKLYPLLKEKNESKLTKEEKRSFFENLYSLLLYKISGVVINGTDNIVISSFIGLKWVGIYSNYLLIINTINTLLGYIFYSVTASVGNLNTTENAEKKFFIFRVLNLVNFWIYGLISVFLWILINPIINFWLGPEFLFSEVVLFFIVLNFFTAGMQNTTTIFRETTGLFKKGKYRPIVAALINIAASIYLANQIGVAGVFLGTVISRMCTYFWYDPYVIYKYEFKTTIQSYYFRYGLFTILVLASIFIIEVFSMLLPVNTVANFSIKFVLCMIIPNVIFFILFRKSEEFEYLISILTGIVQNVKPKNLFKRSYNT